MNKDLYVSDIKSYKNIDEKFIYSLEGNLTLRFIEMPLYSFLPYPSYDYFHPVVYTISIKAVFCATDKRIIILERNIDGSIDKNVIRSFKFNDITIKYNKKLGVRAFTIYKNQFNFFDYSESSMDFQVNSNLIKEADRVYDAIKQLQLF